MKIGFDAKRLYNNFTGLGNYSRTLLAQLVLNFPEHEYYLYASTPRPQGRTEAFFDETAYRLRFSTTKPKAWWRSYGITKSIAKDQIDIFHGLSGELPFFGKIRPKTIVTIHDLIFKHYPEQYGPINSAIYDAKAKHACKQADRVLAISESTKRDIVELYKIPEEKVTVIYQGCDDSFYQQHSAEKIVATQQRHQLPSEYLLYVGSIIERKKLLELVKAYEFIPESKKLPLVVLGNGGKYLKHVKQYIVERQAIRKWIHFKPKMPFVDFPAIYQGATAFIYPSIYEGFGIPIVEALASKTPVISSSKSALMEAGGPHSIYVDEVNGRSLAQAIELVIDDEGLKAKMREKGLEHIQQFEKNGLTRQLVNVYSALLGE
ncbi:MAG: glycosyltransferase family 4 protein [Saprospiraceae bacterium]|nr:glycosyltransferase family 4 protein [Saprospiraceae bacterium]